MFSSLIVHLRNTTYTFQQVFSIILDLGRTYFFEVILTFLTWR